MSVQMSPSPLLLSAPPPSAMASATLLSRMRYWRSAIASGASEKARAALVAEFRRRILEALPLKAPGLTAQEIRELLSLPAGTHTDYTGRQLRDAFQVLPGVVRNGVFVARYWRTPPDTECEAGQASGGAS